MFFDEIRCPECEALLKKKHIKNNECWKCKSGSIKSFLEQKEKELEEQKAKELEEQKANEVDKQNQISELGGPVMPIEKDKSKYPMLIMISYFYNFLAYASIVIAIIYFFLSATSMPENNKGEMVFWLLVSCSISGALAYITFKLFSEIIILFVNIADDVNSIKNKNSV